MTDDGGGIRVRCTIVGVSSSCIRAGVVITGMCAADNVYTNVGVVCTGVHVGVVVCCC